MRKPGLLPRVLRYDQLEPVQADVVPSDYIDFAGNAALRYASIPDSST